MTNRIPMVFTDVVPDEIELAPDLVAQIHEVFPPSDASCESDCVGPQGDEEDIRDCLTRAALATGDLTLESFLNFAVAHMRILDASERVLEQIYSSSGTPVDLSWSRIWTIDLGPRNELVFDLEPPACTERIYPEPVDGSDLRDAVWESVPMDQVESDIYQATPLDSSLTYPACFVRALTADGKPATSGPLLSAALCEASGLVME